VSEGRTSDILNEIEKEEMKRYVRRGVLEGMREVANIPLPFFFVKVVVMKCES